MQHDDESKKGDVYDNLGRSEESKVQKDGTGVSRARGLLVGVALLWFFTLQGKPLRLFSHKRRLRDEVYRLEFLKIPTPPCLCIICRFLCDPLEGGWE